MTNHTPINPHGFDEIKLDKEHKQRERALYNEHQADTRQRVDTLAKAVFVLSGGALTVSLGIFLRVPAPILTLDQAMVLRYSWWALFIAMAGFATVMVVMIIQASAVGLVWQARLHGSDKEYGKFWATATTFVNWTLGLASFVTFIAGLGGLAWLASSVVAP